MKIAKTLSILFFLIMFAGAFSQSDVNAQTRNPVLEFCTGTWCVYCPQGHVIIENDILPAMPNAIIIAYHGGSSDPYANFYGSAIRTYLGFSAYPTGIADRTSAPVSRGEWVTRMNARKNIPPTVEIELLKSYDPVTRQLNMIASVTALEDLEGDYFVSLILMEDKLVYPQTGGTSNYVHDHVVRAMINGAKGVSLNNGVSWSTGETYSSVADYYISNDFVDGNCEVVAMVYRENAPFAQSEIQQAEKYPLVGSNSFNVVVNEGWNLVSAPKEASDMSTSAIFPSAISDIYEFENGYFPVSTIENGEGYWAKFSELEALNIEGNEPTEPVSLNAGWNLIGPFSSTVAIVDITTDPADIVGSSYFGFDELYQATAMLKPGKGYWVKSTAAGSMYFNSGTAKNGNEENVITTNDKWPFITVTDANSKTAKLYLTNQTVDLDKYEMPPAPPQGAIDVRFASGRYVESLNNINYVDVAGMEYPLTIRANGTDLMIKSAGEEAAIKANEPYILKSGGSFSVSSVTIPSEFVLHQNYPNPFNPETKIKFEIPEMAKVNLSVYDLLGQKVTELYNGTMDAGVHEVNFDAVKLSSGVYIYKLTAGEFSVSKKMSVLK